MSEFDRAELKTQAWQWRKWADTTTPVTISIETIFVNVDTKKPVPYRFTQKVNGEVRYKETFWV